ncbi:fam-a protein [Plasmodium yoelii yoelii]|uniref:Fam-a protein n=1 Tax=Plasmodium yoelii yoelii TaxID=73239 RepID=A0AAE9X0S0_PLAYO|nr:fam-a protein [Plasmodium yoelii yoelii]
MNKGYIKIALALLSVAGYMQNMAFATEYASSPDSSNETSKQVLYNDPEEDKQQSSVTPKEEEGLLYDDREEAIKAADVISEALAHIHKHIGNSNEYKLYSKEDDGARLYFKKFKDTEIGKLELTIPNPDSYEGIVNMLWDPNGAKNFDNSFVRGTIRRKYNKDLLITQQRHKSGLNAWKGYYHALAGKIELSEDKTIIVLVSSDMNDHDGGGNKEYINPIVESANSFKPDINSEADIRKGKLSKLYVNLVSFFIKKEPDCVKIIYLISVSNIKILIT